jgi:hypothetical protein
MAKLVGYRYVIAFKGSFRGVRRAKEDAIKFAEKLALGGRTAWDKVTILEYTKDGAPKVIYEKTKGQVKASRLKHLKVRVVKEK